jgi:hypothetical protein
VDASVGLDGRPPPLVALFLITFDLKVGCAHRHNVNRVD